MIASLVLLFSVSVGCVAESLYRVSLRRVYFMSEQNGIALASTAVAELVLVSHTGGTRWTSVYSIYNTLNSVAFQNERIGWIVGNDGLRAGTANSDRGLSGSSACSQP